MEIIVLFFLFFSAFAYALLGGADYGVGVLEFFSANKNRRISKFAAYRIISPVWEANHIWLILIIVIMWICFPIYYNLIVTQLHIPISLVLIGIIGRGTAFVFRHYDAYKDRSQKLYDSIFEISSVFTPFMIGVVFGALLSGNMIHPEQIEDKTFFDLYIATWLNPFSIATGLFTVSLFAYVAASFLFVETKDHEKEYFKKKHKTTTIAVILAGLLLFGVSSYENNAFAKIALNSWSMVVWLFMVTALIYFGNKYSHNKNLFKLILAIQVLVIFIAWAIPVFPNFIIFKNGILSMLENISPDPVINSMGWALIVASIFVLPGLYHLFKTFGLLSK